MLTQASLDALLNTDPQAVVDFERTSFDRAAASFETDLVLVGAGQLGRETLAKLRGLGIRPLAFADNSPTLQGSEVAGLEVLSPRAAVARFNDHATFVTTVWRNSPLDLAVLPLQQTLRSQLERLGCRRIVNFPALYCKYPDVFLPYFALDLPHKVLEQAQEIRRAYALWSDETSRREFVAQVGFRLWHDFHALPRAVAEEQYFCSSLYRPEEKESYVDCGAFDGDSLKSFLGLWGGHLDRYLALEPDPISFGKLNEFVASLPGPVAERITPRQLATGSRSTKVRIEPTGLASSRTGQGSVEVDCSPLDDVLGELTPTTIKMDIEGAEWETLLGARRVIESHRPLLKVCVYHTQHHLWTLPLLIHEMRGDYQFYLRSHRDEAFELVCYAVPPSRAVIGTNDTGRN